jgi:hypothetical protein
MLKITFGENYFWSCQYSSLQKCHNSQIHAQIRTLIPKYTPILGIEFLNLRVTVKGRSFYFGNIR